MNYVVSAMLQNNGMHVEPPYSPMVYQKDILKNPAAAAVLDQFCEGASKNPQMKLVGGLTLRKLASFPQSAYLQPHLDELDKALQAIE